MVAHAIMQNGHSRWKAHWQPFPTLAMERNCSNQYGQLMGRNEAVKAKAHAQTNAAALKTEAVAMLKLAASSVTCGSSFGPEDGPEDGAVPQLE